MKCINYETLHSVLIHLIPFSYTTFACVSQHAVFTDYYLLTSYHSYASHASDYRLWSVAMQRAFIRNTAGFLYVFYGNYKSYITTLRLNGEFKKKSYHICLNRSINEMYAFRH